MKNPRKVVILDEKRTAPLLLISQNDGGLARSLDFNCKHLLRDVDYAKVKPVVSKLNERGLEVYLAGTALTHPLFKGWTHAYSDVDLVAVGKMNDVSDLVKRLRSSSEGAESLFDYTANATIDGESLDYQVRFNVSEGNRLQGSYVPTTLAGKDLTCLARFNLTVRAPVNSGAKPLDLIIYNREKFGKSAFVGA